MANRCTFRPIEKLAESLVSLVFLRAAQSSCEYGLSTGNSRCARTAFDATAPPRSIFVRWLAGASKHFGNLG